MNPNINVDVLLIIIYAVLVGVLYGILEQAYIFYENEDTRNALLCVLYASSVFCVFLADLLRSWKQ